MRVCDAEGFVAFETNRYSAPSGHIADILTIKATEHEILIFSPEIDLISRHERLPAGQGKKVENPDHFATKKVRYGFEPVREAFIALGEAAEEFLKGIDEKHPRRCGFHARYILRMKEHYESGDIHGAVAHALKYRAFDAHAVERILKAKAEPRTLESARNEKARKDLEQHHSQGSHSGPSKNTASFWRRTMKTIPDETLTKIRGHLKTLKLAGMEKALEKELSEAAKKGSAPMDLLERLLSIEANALIERRMERRVRESRLPERKLLADFDFAFQTGLDKAQVMEIAKLDFVERKQGLVIAGNSGTGKVISRKRSFFWDAPDSTAADIRPRPTCSPISWRAGRTTHFP